MTVKIGFYGGAGTVTGSRFLLETSHGRVLIDCGLFQGLKALRLLNWEPLPFDPRGLDAVLLTHAHIDHSGYLPRLVKAGFRGPIYCTEPTRDLARILLLDSARLQEEEADYANRKGFSKHHPALPLYTEAEATRAVQQMKTLPWGKRIDVGGCEPSFMASGHILGSSFIDVFVPEGGRDGTRIVFSGDLGRYDAPLHTDPRPLPECDAVVIESTYGDREHPAESFADQLREPLQRVIEHHGTVLIPAFAVTRAQLLVMLLRRAMDAGELPTLPIHVDSPMAVEVTQTYARHIASPDVEVGQREVLPRGVRFHSSVAESRALNEMPGPRIIISSSGMMTGGRVLHHLKRILPNHNNLLVLAGYQAAGTRGRALQDGARSLRVHGEDVPVRCQFMELKGLSAHADAEDLQRWLQTAPHLPKTAFLAHGEPEALTAMSKRIAGLGIETIVPELDSRYALEDGAWVRDRGPGRSVSDSPPHRR